MFEPDLAVSTEVCHDDGSCEIQISATDAYARISDGDFAIVDVLAAAVISSSEINGSMAWECFGGFAISNMTFYLDKSSKKHYNWDYMDENGLL